MDYFAHNLAETYQIAADFAESLEGGEVVGLSGDLGSGKTTFTKGLAKSLGIDREVTSPTFVIVKEYEIQNRKFHRLVHVDAYRLSGQADVEAIGLSEKFNDGSLVTIIEWPEKIAGSLPEKTVYINFEYIDDQTRKITFD